MEIRSIQGPQGLDALAATAAPPAQPAEPLPTSNLAPAVKLDIGTDAHEARFVRDVDTSTMVFQVVDQSSGDVLAQLPSESALRNRAYAHTSSQAGSGNVSRIA